LEYIPNFIWIEEQKIIITASHDKTIKLYQFPLKWPAEFLRINKQMNDLSIIKEIKSETKNAYNELYYNTSIFNYDDEKNKKDKDEQKENNENDFNANNQIVKDFWKLKEKNENKKDENSSENEDEDECEEDENSNIVYDKPEKYEKIDIIFCEDLNGWSK
jgi:hypothetical protein